MTVDETVEWHHWHNGHGFGWTLGVGDRQGGLVYCDSWGCKESDTTEWLNWTEHKVYIYIHTGPILCMNKWDRKWKNFVNCASPKMRFPPRQFSESPLLSSILTVVSLLLFRSIFYSLMTIILMKSLSIPACCCLVAKPCLILLRPQGLWSPRLLCLWDFPGKNTGVCCHFLLGSFWPRY